jgi:hypothetical protein
MSLRDDLTALCDGTKTYRELAETVGKSKCYVEELVREMNLPRPKRDTLNARKSSPENQKKIDQVKKIADGNLTSEEISTQVGLSHKYVQKILLRYDLPRLPQAPRSGKHNPSWAGGRHIDLDGYVLIKAPKNHPLQRMIGRIYEHRLVMEQTLGRYLEPLEVVDHIDSLTIHNDPKNLRLFASNSDHLKATISGYIPAWSQDGKEKLIAARSQQKHLKVVDTYRRRKEQGDVRLQTILRAWLQLDKASPYLLGTLRWLEQAEIFDLSRSSLEHHLQLLSQKYT